MTAAAEPLRVAIVVYATTHHVALDALRAVGAEVITERVVDDGDLVTSGGVTSGIDMALWLVERHFGADRAAAIAGRIEHDRRGGVHLGAGGRPAVPQ